MWADYAFYTDVYLLGDTPLIPEVSFPRWEQAARRKIDRRGIVDVPTDELKHCVCEVADELYSQSQSESLKAVHSFNNDGFSRTYVDQRKKQEDVNRKINGIIARRLDGSKWWNDLVFSGA